MQRRWLVLLGAVGILAMAVLVWWIVRDPHPPVEPGGRDSGPVAGGNFGGGGDLLRDQDLLERAAEAWRGERDGLADPIRALWAGRTPQGRTVVLQSGEAFAVVQFASQGDPAVGQASMVGDRFIVTQAGVLVADGLPPRWRAITARASGGGLAGVANLDAIDGLVQAEADDLLRALMPLTEPRSGAVPALIGDGGGLRAVEVDPRDWPRLRDAMSDGLFAPFAVAAVAAATGSAPLDGVPAQHARILHIGDVPGDDIGVAASSAVGGRTLIAFASGRARKPDVDLLGVAARGATALAARSLDRSPGGPWLVVAGSPNIESLLLGDDVRRGNFALLEDSSLRVERVRGRLASGREIRPVGP